MKTWKKVFVTLSSIALITTVPLAIVSCSNNANLVSKNSNNKNSNQTNNENSTNFVPYTDLTKTVTKEPSFNAALTNWTNKWKQLISNKETYLKMITNDLNTLLNYSTQEENSDPTWISTMCHIKNTAITQSFDNVNVSLNQNNTFNISFNLIAHFGYIENNKFSNGFDLIQKIKLLNATFKPYLFVYQYSSSNPNKQIVYSGEFMNSFDFDMTGSLSTISSLPNNNATIWIKKYYEGYTKAFQSKKNCYSFLNETYTSSLPISSSSIIESPLQNPYNCGIYIDSYNNGINYGKQIYPVLNN